MQRHTNTNLVVLAELVQLLMMHKIKYLIELNWVRPFKRVDE